MPAAESMLQDLFTSADQVLLEYADKAETNAVRVKFFDGQREVRIKQNEIVSMFKEALGKDLFEFMRPARSASAPDSEVLSLVSTDAYERSLALKTISEQAVRDNKELYYALSQRLGVVSGGRAIPLDDLPAGPHQLAGRFERAAHLLNVERQVLLALYTLFEREVIRNSPPWHDELNEELRKGGILPNLKYKVKRYPKQTRTDPAKAEEQDDSPPPIASQATNTPARGRVYASGNRAAQNVTSPSATPRRGRYVSGDEATPLGQANQGYADQGAYGGNLSRSASHAAADLANAYQASPSAHHGSAAATDTAARDTQASQSSQDLGDQLLGRIRELLSARRAGRQRADGTPMSHEIENPAPEAMVAAAIDSPRIQRVAPLPQTGVRTPGTKQVLVSRDLLEKLRIALSSQRTQIKKMVGPDRLSHIDEDTIDIVGMLFEVMLKDQRLGNTVKALLSHLHTPYLKLAIRDHAFLKRHQHPARCLFDNLIEAGSRWVEENDLTIGMYPKLQSVVDSITQARELTSALFLSLDEKLASDIKLLSECQQIREMRTLEAEKGKDRLDEARQVAGGVASESLAVDQVPTRYETFINDPWTDYLTLLYLRTNGDTASESWRAAIAVGEQLRSFVDDLTKGGKIAGSDLLSMRTEIEQRLSGTIPHYESKVQQLFELFLDTEDIDLAAPPAATPGATEVPPEPGAEPQLSKSGEALLERLPKLPPGSWLIFRHKGELAQVVKLSWYNPRTQRFLFVDQAGAKALVVPLRELADHIGSERAHVLHATGTSYVESSLERALASLHKGD